MVIVERVTKFLGVPRWFLMWYVQSLGMPVRTLTFFQELLGVERGTAGGKKIGNPDGFDMDELKKFEEQMKHEHGHGHGHDHHGHDHHGHDHHGHGHGEIPDNLEEMDLSDLEDDDHVEL